MIGRGTAARCSTNAASGVLGSIKYESSVDALSSIGISVALARAGSLVRRIAHSSDTGCGGRQGAAWMLVAAAAAAAALLSQQQPRLGLGVEENGGGACLCKGKGNPADRCLNCVADTSVLRRLG